MNYDFTSDAEVLPCAIKLKEFEHAHEADYCGACARTLREALAEGETLEVLSLDERASCDRCGHLSGYGLRLERLRKEREAIERAREERERRGEAAQLVAHKRRPRVADPPF
jgi:uncharacterized protein with PIN domain